MGAGGGGAHPHQPGDRPRPVTVATLWIVFGLLLAAGLLTLLILPLHVLGLDLTRGLYVTAERKPRGVVIRLEPVPSAKSVVVFEVGVSRPLADELALKVPDALRESVTGRWVVGKGRLRVGEPVELLFAARNVPDRPVGGGQVYVVYRYRMGVVRRRDWVDTGIRYRRPRREGRGPEQDPPAS